MQFALGKAFAVGGPDLKLRARVENLGNHSILCITGLILVVTFLSQSERFCLLMPTYILCMDVWNALECT